MNQQKKLRVLVVGSLNMDLVLEDLAATGWTRRFDAMRRTIARESRAVHDFSDECRFWVAQSG